MSQTMEKLTVVEAAPMPASHIKPTSFFTARSRACCRCNEEGSSHDQQCIKAECTHGYCTDCPQLDSRGREVIPHSFPCNWVCNTCSEVHSVLSILVKNVECKCEKPTLRAIYDQFGRIFLYFRNDPAVDDLTDPAKVQEAAWRVWEAGAEPWLPHVIAAEEAIARASSKKGWSQLSQASFSSEDPLDMDMSETTESVVSDSY